RMLGVKEGDVLAEKWHALVHPDDLTPLLENWRQSTAAEEVFAYECRGRTSQGTDLWLATRAIPLRKEGGTLARYLGTLKGGHSRRKVEDALRASEQQLRMLVENMPAGAVYRKGDILMMNRAVEDITGYLREEISTIDEWFSILGRENAARARRHYERERGR